MSAFDKAFEIVVGVEGGYVNDPHDPGGETKFGISKRAYPDLDIAALTLDDARKIYRRDYWKKCRCDELPPSIAMALFDCAVHQGADVAVRTLQKALDVAVDGKIGKVTIVAARKADEKVLLADFMAERALSYTTLDGFPRYGKGWLRRLFTVTIGATTA